MMTTALWSRSSMLAFCILYSLLASGVNRHWTAVFQRNFREPAQIVKPAQQISALGEGLALVTEVRVRQRSGVKHLNALQAHGLKKRGRLHFFQCFDPFTFRLLSEVRSEVCDAFSQSFEEVFIFAGVGVDRTNDESVGRIIELVVWQQRSRHGHEHAAFGTGKRRQIDGPRSAASDRRK